MSEGPFHKEIQRAYLLNACLRRHKYSIVLVSWDDPARTKALPGKPKSGVFGPCIADSTVSYWGPDGRLRHCSIIRPCNYTDVTADRLESNFSVPVEGPDGSLINIPLLTYLLDGKYVGGQVDTPLMRPGEHILCSAQACVVPPGPDGIHQEFALTTYTYGKKLLVLVVSHLGTSAYLITKGTHDVMTLLHQKGDSAYRFLATKSSVARTSESAGAGAPAPKEGGDDSYAADTMLFVFQIPMKPDPKPEGAPDDDMELAWPISCVLDDEDRCLEEVCIPGAKAARRRTEVAVVTAGLRVGTATAIPETTKLERDFDFPIRCTAQFYNIGPDITEDDVEFVAPFIQSMYTGAEAVGSLITGEGDQGRKTEADPQALANYSHPMPSTLATFLPWYAAPAPAPAPAPGPGPTPAPTPKERHGAVYG